MTRRFIGAIVTVIGYRLIRLGMRIAGIKMHVSVVRGQAYPSAWTSAHEQQPVNTVTPRGDN